MEGSDGVVGVHQQDIPASSECVSQERRRLGRDCREESQVQMGRMGREKQQRYRNEIRRETSEEKKIKRKQKS